MLPPGRSLSCKLPAMSCPGSGQCTPTTGSIPALHGSAPPFATLSHSGEPWTTETLILHVKDAVSEQHMPIVALARASSIATQPAEDAQQLC